MESRSTYESRHNMLATVAAVCIGLVLAGAVIAGCYELTLARAFGAPDGGVVTDGPTLRFKIDTTQQLSNGFAKRLSIRSNAREVAYVDASGVAHAAPGVSADELARVVTDIMRRQANTIEDYKRRLDECLGRDEEAKLVRQ